MIIHHPETYKTGTRCLWLVSRRKDGLKAKSRMRLISHDPDQFDRRLADLNKLRCEGERVYASVDARDLLKAARVFRRSMLETEFNPKLLEDTYRVLPDRWFSALMNSASRQTKYMLVDVDAELTEADVERWLLNVGATIIYRYKTKNGMHFITQPFNRAHLPNEVKDAVHPNALMLWSY